jgi:hypothetical protein
MISSLSFQFFNYTPIITIPFFLASPKHNIYIYLINFKKVKNPFTNIQFIAKGYIKNPKFSSGVD